MAGAYDGIHLYVKTISCYERISVEREKELSYIILNSTDQHEVDKTVEEMVTSNLFLVIACARRFLGKFHGTLSFMDLIAEGNIGLLRAVRGYDATHESTSVFSSYAGKIIDRSIKRAIKLDKLIHIPESHIKHRIALMELEEEYGNELSDCLVAEKLEISEGSLRRVRDGIESGAVSYLENIREDTEAGWQDVVEDKTTLTVDEELAKKNLCEYLSEHMKFLEEREREVVSELHFNPKGSSLKILGDKLDISPERVRQIHARALRKLRGRIIADWNKNNDKKVGISRRFNDKHLIMLRYAYPDRYDRLYEERHQREMAEASEIVNHFLEKS